MLTRQRLLRHQCGPRSHTSASARPTRRRSTAEIRSQPPTRDPPAAGEAQTQIAGCGPPPRTTHSPGPSTRRTEPRSPIWSSWLTIYPAGMFIGAEEGIRTDSRGHPHGGRGVAQDPARMTYGPHARCGIAVLFVAGGRPLRDADQRANTARWAKDQGPCSCSAESGGALTPGSSALGNQAGVPGPGAAQRAQAEAGGGPPVELQGAPSLPGTGFPRAGSHRLCAGLSASQTRPGPQPAG